MQCHGLHTTLGDVHIRAMRLTARQRRLERLAWAGGFFDGEGSTFARSAARRPGYRRLNVAVPQRGDAAVPEGLIRVRVAGDGLGRISKPVNEPYQWRVGED